jgi:hypothetical protein
MMVRTRLPKRLARRAAPTHQRTDENARRGQGTDGHLARRISQGRAPSLWDRTQTWPE